MNVPQPAMRKLHKQGDKGWGLFQPREQDLNVQSTKEIRKSFIKPSEAAFEPRNDSHHEHERRVVDQPQAKDKAIAGPPWFTVHIRQAELDHVLSA